MAELGATVLAFVSLAKMIHPLYTAFSTIHGAPRELQFFRNQLGSLRFVVTELASLQEKAPTDVFIENVADALTDIEVPLRQDIAALQTLLDKTRIGHSGRPPGWGRIKFLFKSGEYKQLAQRLGTYRDSLNTVLLLLQSQYILPRQHDLLTRTYLAATHVESITASTYKGFNKSASLPQYYVACDSSAQANSFVDKLNVGVRNLRLQQQAHYETFTSQLAAMDSMMAEMSRSSAHSVTNSWGGPRVRFKYFKRLDFDFCFGSVVISWGPLRSKRRRGIINEFDEESAHSSGLVAQPHGFAANIEIVPAMWLSHRVVIGSWKLVRDQRYSPTISPDIAFPVTVPAMAKVMSCAALGDVVGLRALFNDREASVTDRSDGGWTPLHVAAAAGQISTCKYLLLHSADVTSTGRVGLTPLHLAAAYGHLDIIKILVEHDGDPEAYNQHGFNTMFERFSTPQLS